uniref:Uncharacterized protein n=1 Tax=Anguilla anguilla TaxID=7936 RepID=A0A0E9RYZ3_ANGAN
MKPTESCTHFNRVMSHLYKLWYELSFRT